MTDQELAEAVAHSLADEHQCYICKTWVLWDEWVVNWGSCSECFNTHYEEYLRERDADDGRREG